MGKREKKKAETRASLKRAARLCLEGTSFPDLQISAITREAGVATGTFYVHFPNKEALLDEVFIEFNERQAERIGAVWQGGMDTPSDTLRRVAGAVLDAWMAERRLLEAFVRRAATSSSLGALRDGINPPVAAYLSQAISAFAASRGAEIAHPGLITQAVLGMWMRVALQYLFNPEISRDAAVETLTTMTLGAVSAAVPAGAHRGETP